MNIDWSKAPDDAKGHALIGCEVIPVWVGDTWYEYMDGKRYEFSRSDFCLTRPRTQISQYRERWNGEGLPPVGVVCEYDASINSSRETYSLCQIEAYAKGQVIFSCPETGDRLFINNPEDCGFRPIRTPEQIAAEERDQARTEVLNAMTADGKLSDGIYEYRAGEELDQAIDTAMEQQP